MSRGTQDSLTVNLPFAYRGVTFSAETFQSSSARDLHLIEGPTTPISRFEIRCTRFDSVFLRVFKAVKNDLIRTSNFDPRTSRPVWALPVSLAATQGIDYSFSSSGYLDVSVPRVVFFNLCIQLKITGYDSGWVAPFGYPRIKACLRLPVAFRC